MKETWAMSPNVITNITKIAAAGALIAIPAAFVGISANAAPSSGGPANAPTVITAPAPMDPATNEPAPPPPATHGEYYSPNDQDDWWVYSGTGSY